VRVAIPDTLRIEAFPGGGDQLVPGELQRQADAAGIPEALLGPEFPDRERAGAGERTGAEQ
jgi:hypothetical protein